MAEKHKSAGKRCQNAATIRPSRQALSGRIANAMTTIAQDRELATPHISPEIAPFFEGSARGVLMLKYCDACQRHHYYPRALCPH